MRLSIVLAIALGMVASAAGADWGDLKMRFVYDGEPPTPKRFQAGAAGEIADESLVVNQSDRGIQKVFVYLLPDHNAGYEVHPDYSQTAADTVTMKLARGKLVPRAAIVRTTQTLTFQNSDTVAYNLKYDLFQNKPFSALLPVGGSASATFAAEENVPAHISGVIHPWIVGQMLVRADPYFGLSDEHGRVTINKLPTGKRTFVVWHERVGFVQKVTQNDQTIAWSRGRVIVDMQAGDNDLGDIKLAPEIFK